MVKCKDMQFCMEIWKWKEKGQNCVWPFEAGIQTPDFIIFPTMIWIFMEGKGEGIKSRQPSEIFSTLRETLHIFNHLPLTYLVFRVNVVFERPLKRNHLHISKDHTVLPEGFCENILSSTSIMLRLENSLATIW